MPPGDRSPAWAEPVTVGAKAIDINVPEYWRTPHQ